MLYFSPWLPVSELVDWLEIKPDACQCYEHKGGSLPCLDSRHSKCSAGTILKLSDTCKKVGGVGR